MSHVIVGVICFAAGGYLVWIYKSRVQAKIQAELEAFKSSATRAINKL